MAVISQEVQDKAHEIYTEVISASTFFEGNRITMDYFGLTQILNILTRVKTDELSNEDALKELNALDTSKIKADLENRSQKRIEEVERLRARTEKGKSLLAIQDSYVVVDLETTGLDPIYDDIIEIGAIMVEDGKIIDRYSSLVNPGYEISEFVTSLTGITNEMLADAPTLEEVLPRFDVFVGTATVLGHNVNFDVNFLYSAYELVLCKPFKNDFIDTMRMSRRLFPNERHHRLFDLLMRFGIDDYEEHRALSDALQTHACYCYMKDYMKNNDIPLSSLQGRKHNHSIRGKDIVASGNIEIDESSSFYQRVFVFTGTLEKMGRKEAMQHVADRGGICGDSVTKKTNYLILGNNDYCTSIKGGKSNKQKKAEQLLQSGADIEILSENVFYDMLGSDQ